VRNVLRADSCFLYSFKLSLWLNWSMQSSSFLSLLSSKSFIFWPLTSLGDTQTGSLSFSRASSGVDGSTYFQIRLVLALDLITLSHSSQSFGLARIIEEMVISVSYWEFIFEASTTWVVNYVIMTSKIMQ